jgi:hypothetical protein
MSEDDETRRMTPKKLAALSATVLLVSLGLCGANFFLVLRFVPFSGPGPQPGQPSPSNWPGNVLTATGVLELIGIAAGLIGLCFAWIWNPKE